MLQLYELWDKFVELIMRDTNIPNESKKTAVVIRILCVSLIVYLLIPVIVTNIISATGGFVIYIFELLCFCGIFAATYHYKALYVFFGLCGAVLIWIISIIFLFGWNVGVQHFLMVLLVLGFFSQYLDLKKKAIFAASLCIIRIILYYVFCGNESVISITSRENDSFQMVNTIIIFWCISMITYYYGNDSQELETKLIKYNEELVQLANTDKLTGLCNRRKAMEYLEECCENSSNNGFCVCICDIDFFKKVNDNYGHDMGDEVLKAIAKVFKQEMEGKFMASRWGGEEFLLLFPDTNGDTAFVKLCEIRRKIKNLVVKKNDMEIRVTMTFGLAEYDYSGNHEAMLTNADKKLYRGKESGRDRIVY